VSLSSLSDAEARALTQSRNGDMRVARDTLLAAAEEALRLASLSADSHERQRLFDLSAEYQRLANDLGSRRAAPRNTPQTRVSQPARQNRTRNREQVTKESWQAAERPTLTLGDVAGMEDLKRLVRRELIDPINFPELDALLNIPHGFGVLLYGPPGTGKTHFARALAGELDCAFFIVEPASILSKWVGESEQQLVALMERARSEPRAIVYIDEIAEMFPRRGTGSVYSDRLVGVFLQELDGFEQSGNLLLTIGSTNHPARIDQTLIRSGRLGKHIYVGLPDYPARQAILAIEMRDVPLDDSVNLDAVADDTAGYSAADVVAVAREARKQARDRLIQARAGNGRASADVVHVTQADIVAALCDVSPAQPDPRMLAELEQFRQGRI